MVRKSRIALFLVLCIMLQCVCLCEPDIGRNVARAAELEGYCTANTLNVRSGPGTGYAIVTSGGSLVQLHKNDRVTVLKTSGDWYQIRMTFQGRAITGYCFAAYIKTEPVQANSPTPTKAATATPTKAPDKTPTPAGAVTYVSATVTANSLNIRKDAGTSYTKVATLSKDTGIRVYGSKKDSAGAVWYRMTATVGGKEVSGYMLGTYIKLARPLSDIATPTPTKKATVTPTKAPTQASSRLGYVDAGALNIRSGAGTNYSKYATLNRNTRVTILAEQKDGSGALWYRVTVNYQGSQITGYVLAVYIAVTGIAPPITNMPKPTATNTPKPTATSTPKPTATSTPKPTATSTPKPTATNTPRPTATNTPKPTATNTPKPTATSTPKPTATSTPKPTATSTPKPRPTYAIAANVTAMNLNMRSGAGTEFGKLVTLTKNHPVTVTGTDYDKNGDLWYLLYTTVNEKRYEGYMLATYVQLSEELPDEEDIPINAPVDNPPYWIEAKMNASSVNLRSGPSTAYSILGKLYDRQILHVYGMVLSDSMVWYLVSVELNGKEVQGYAASQYMDLTWKNYDIWATVQTAGQLYKTPAGTVQTDASGAGISVSKGQMVCITGEYTAGGVKWMKVACQWKKTVVYGYVKLQNLLLCAQPDPIPFSPYDEDGDFLEKMRAEGFPESYLPYLLALHQEHPNWTFTAMQTGLKWADVISNEDTVGYNLIPNSKALKWLSFAPGAYAWDRDAFIPYDGSTWVTVSNAGLQYFMDPRNWLTEQYVFMFESLKADSENQTQAGVENILKGTPMYKTKFSYKDADGNTKSILYSQAFMEAAEYSGVSAYHLASRVKQEVVISSTQFSQSVSGTVSGFEGYYNFYNIGAYNSTASLGAIKNGLKFAKYGSTSSTMNQAAMIPWNNRYRALVGGAYYIGNNYISRGQDTIYLQKFNVSAKNTYGHQYMANVEAPKSEAYKVYLAYSAMDKFETMKISFSIPVYNDMPKKAVAEPAMVRNPNNYLSGLKVKDNTGKALDFTSAFSYNVTEYTVKAGKSVTSVTISGTSAAGTAVIVSGAGSHKVSDGKNTFEIAVKAADETIRKYKITVVK